MLRERGCSGPGTPRVVFVCDGNTCRSPLAEVLARALFGEESSCFLSAGLTARTGAPAHPLAVAVAAARGLALDEHRARPVGAVVGLGPVAWLIAMTRSQAVRLRAAGRIAGRAAVGILGAPGLDVAGPGPTPTCPEVADPWGGDVESYRRTAGQIVQLLEAWRPLLAGRGTAQGEGA